MKINPKLQAFTLLEITIAMVLVAIIAGFAYYALNTFAHLAIDQQIKKRDKYQVELLMHRLSTDWNQAETISYDDNVLLMNDSLGAISYTFLDSLILRNQYKLRIDSFYLKIEIINTETLAKNNYDSRLIKCIHAAIHLNNKNIPIELYKEYAAYQILNSSIGIKYDTD